MTPEHSSLIKVPGPNNWSYLSDYDSEMLWLTRSDDTLTWVNPCWIEFTGVDISNNASQFNIIDLIHADDIDQVLNTHTTSRTNKKPYEIEYRLRNSQGEYAWVYDRGKPLYDLTGIFLGFQGCCRDISRFIASEQSIREFENDSIFLLQLARELQQATTFKQTLEITASAMKDYVGYNSAVMYIRPEPDADHVLMIDAGGDISDNITSHYPVLHIPGDQFLEDVMSATGPFIVENMREDPRTNKDIVKQLDLWTTINVPIKLGIEYFGTLATASIGDEGIRPPTERQLRLLEQMANQIAPVVERMLYLSEKQKIEQDLRKANDAKNDFLAQMSHELRTPLNAILGYSQLLELDETLGEKHRQSAQDICRAGQHLLNYVNEVLDLSIIEKDKLLINAEEFIPDQHIKDAISLNQKLANKNKVKINYSSPAASKLTCYGDPVRFKQILLNLISNAIKYNSENGQVTISIDQPDSKHLKFSVKDTGIGINEADFIKLFEPFERFTPHKNTIEGFGIGLSITKSLVELMGGEIGLESKLGKGSEFWFTIPTEK